MDTLPITHTAGVTGAKLRGTQKEVRIIAEGMVDLQAMLCQQHTQAAQETDGLTNRGHTDPNDGADAGQAGKSPGAVAGLLAQIHSNAEGTGAEILVKQITGWERISGAEGQIAVVDCLTVYHSP